ncbi:MAG TPA: 2'-5' RNA ligase family protein [Patescibacteria group bacterium]
MLLQRNIVILFDDALTQEFINLSEKINKKVPSDIVLNKADMHPHATLYTTNFPEENEKKVIDKLQEITAHLNPFSMTFSKPVVDMLGVWINADIIPELQQVHEIIVDGLNPFREGLYDEGELKAIGDNKKRQESLVKYGMWAAKELYIPHVTLSRPKDSSRLEEAMALLPQKTNYQANITEIAYVERGRFGTCKKILEKFPLS